jgi:hypothetical protein
MPEETPITAPLAAPDSPYARATEDEVATLRARVAQLEQAKTAAPSPAPPAPAPAPPAPIIDMSRFDQLERVMERDRKSALVATVRQMGFNAALSDVQILALVPDVDPREPGGVAKVEEFRQQNPSLFRSSGPTHESMIEAMRVDVSTMAKGGKLFNADALVRSLFGGPQ